MLMNLKVWNLHNLTNVLTKLVFDLRKINLFKYPGMSTFESSQMPMIFLFNNDDIWIEPLPCQWNICGLGWKAYLPHTTFDGAMGLHWTGNYKPWNKRTNEEIWGYRWWTEEYWWREYHSIKKQIFNSTFESYRKCVETVSVEREGRREKSKTEEREN